MVGATDAKLLGLVHLFQRIVSEPFFDTLRTKQQLGKLAGKKGIIDRSFELL
jgi:secreted Zn-dependent insulinase-like peptidase